MSPKAVRYESPWYMSSGYKTRTLTFMDGSTTTVYEHRLLMEKALGRKLRSGEVVHHIDGNPSNNSLNNLEILSNREHAKHHAAQKSQEAQLELSCLMCRKVFTRTRCQERYYRKIGKKGPFCGKSCVGRWVIAQYGAPLQKRVGGFVHGSSTGYKYHGCRCAVCRSENAERARRQRANRKKHAPIIQGKEAPLLESRQ